MLRQRGSASAYHTWVTGYLVAAKRLRETKRYRLDLILLCSCDGAGHAACWSAADSLLRVV